MDDIYRKSVLGLHSSFWADPWAGSIFLKDIFPRLFSIINYLGGSVGEFDIRVDMNLIWDLRWKMPLFVHDEFVVDEFLWVI